MNRKYLATFLSTLFLALPALPSLACAVCFGDTDSPMAGAMNMSILFMILVTYLVIGGGLVAFFVLRFKARRKVLEEATVLEATAASALAATSIKIG